MDGPLQLLYADAALAVCVKPPGLLSEPAAAPNLPARLAAQLSASGDPARQAAPGGAAGLSATEKAPQQSASGKGMQPSASGDPARQAAPGGAAGLSATEKAPQQSASGKGMKPSATGEPARQAAPGGAAGLSATEKAPQQSASGKGMQPSASGDPARQAAPGKPAELFTVHRLDREVGGLCVLARTHEAASALIAQFAARSTDKEYCAVLRGVPAQPRAVLEDLLFRDASRGKSYVVRRERKGVRRAKLEYALLETRQDETGQPLSLVRVRLFTGRTHQIRVQFASRGLPLLGDGRYGGRDERCGVSLFSCLLAFDHPATGRRMRFYQRPPEAFPWSLFSDQCYARPYSLFAGPGGTL